MFDLVEPLDPRPMTPAECSVLVGCYTPLLAAWARAELRRVNSVDFPVPLTSLPGVARAEHLIVWMYYQGHVEHLQPKRVAHTRKRRWHAVDTVHFNKSSAVALTGRGATFAEEFLSASLTAGAKEKRAAWARLITGRLTPRFKKNEFTWGCHVLKHFTQSALSQRLLLQALEEDGWAALSDNPFTGGGRINPKTRLHETIKSLNHNQKKNLIHFGGDGTGQRVGWEYR